MIFFLLFRTDLVDEATDDSLDHQFLLRQLLLGFNLVGDLVQVPIDQGALARTFSCNKRKVL